MEQTPDKLSLEQVYNACHRFIWHWDSKVKIVNTPTELRYIISNIDVWGIGHGILYICIPHYAPKSPQNQIGRILYCSEGSTPRWIATTHHNIAHAMDKSAPKLIRLVARLREPEFFDLVDSANIRPEYRRGTPGLGTQNPYLIMQKVFQKQK